MITTNIKFSSSSNSLLELFKEGRIVSDVILSLMEEDSIGRDSFVDISAVNILVESDLEKVCFYLLLINSIVESSWVCLVHLNDCLFNLRRVIIVPVINLDMNVVFSTFGLSEVGHLE